jgi:type I restriction enzyme, S subunit
VWGGSRLSQVDKLPESWIWAKFQDILIKVKRGPSKKCNTDGRGIRYITSGNLANGFLDLALDYKFLDDLEGIENCILLPGDLILNCVNSLERIGKSAVFQESHGEAIVGFNNYGIELRKCLVDPQYLNFFCQGQTFKDQVFFSVKRAVNQVSFATRELNQLNVSLPPLNEQRRIVEKIEALTARSRKARAALDEIPALLNQFRQSVLAAAFCGDLTADWRAQNPNLEPAEALLERIYAEI